MKDNSPLYLEMVIYDPNSPPDAPPIRTHDIWFHTKTGRDFMNRTAIWAWQAGYAVATRRLDKMPDRP